MSFILYHADGLTQPHFQCEHCKNLITDASNALLLWSDYPPGGVIHPHVVCKKCDYDWVPYSMQLDTALMFLLNNSGLKGISPKTAYRKAKLRYWPNTIAYLKEMIAEVLGTDWTLSLAARQYAMTGLKIWRSGNTQPVVEELSNPAVSCLYWLAMCEWHFGETLSCQESIAEAIALAKELNDFQGLAVALIFAGILAQLDGDAEQVERFASDTIEVSTRQNFPNWLAAALTIRGWARVVRGKLAEGISLIEEGIRGYQACRSMVNMSYILALKAETLYLAHRTSEALEAISDTEVLVERFEERHWCAELHRLRGVFLAAIGADQTQIEASFRAAITTAKEQKSVSLEKRAEATYAEYRRQKASGSGGRGFRLPL